jgi:hypothetical protein
MENPTQEPKCPKCGSGRDPKAEECPSCGIIFEKYEMVQRRKAREQVELESPEVVHTPEDNNPKLTQCKTCKQKIAKTAKACPHCGEKNPGIKDMGPGCMVFFLAVVFIYSFIAFGLDGDGNNHVQKTTLEDRMVASGGVDPGLPPHTIDSDTSLFPKNGRVIHLNSNNPQLTRNDCIKLINAYRKKAGPEGQVGVSKPSRALEGRMAPWCVENFDGKGIVFQDYFFD